MPKYTKDGKIKGPGEIMEDASRASANYEKAKGTDPNLKLYIKKRKELRAKGFTTKDPELAKIQNAINEAYGVKKRYEVNEVSRKEDDPREKLRVEKEKRNAANPSPPKAKLIEPPTEIKFDSPTPKVAGAKKPAAAKKTTTDAGGRDLAKVVSEEIKRDTPASKKKEPTRKEKRKATRVDRRNKPVKTTAAAKADKALEDAANRPMKAGGAKPDYLDMDGDGNKKESMKSAIRSKKGMGGKKLYKSGGIKKAKKMYGGMKDRRK